jgi:hypothetical protein
MSREEWQIAATKPGSEERVGAIRLTEGEAEHVVEEFETRGYTDVTVRWAPGRQE